MILNSRYHCVPKSMSSTPPMTGTTSGGGKMAGKRRSPSANANTTEINLSQMKIAVLVPMGTSFLSIQPMDSPPILPGSR